MREISRAQDLILEMLELASFNSLDGAKVASDLRNSDSWRSVILTRLVRPAYTKLVNPFSRARQEFALENRVDLIWLRDLPNDDINLDTLIILVEPGRHEELDALTSSWESAEREWFGVVEARQAMGTNAHYFTEYPDDSRVLLRVWWD